MFAATDANLIIGIYAVIGVAGYLFWRLLAWVRSAPTKPDPWDAEVEKEIEAAPEICPHCSTPQPPTAWFCEHCGRAVGPYNNLMPYIQVFSEGEVLRNGTQDRMRKSPLIVIGYFLISFDFLVLGLSLTETSFVAAAAVLFGLASFWAALFRNLFRRETPSPGNQ
jgi:hypothetical protein